MVSTKTLLLKHYHRHQGALAKGIPQGRCRLDREGAVYHPFQNHYTLKIIIFELFRSLQLQFSGPTGINFVTVTVSWV